MSLLDDTWHVIAVLDPFIQMELERGGILCVKFAELSLLSLSIKPDGHGKKTKVISSESNLTNGWASLARPEIRVALGTMTPVTRPVATITAAAYRGWRRTRTVTDQPPP